MRVRLKEKIPGVFWPVHTAIRSGGISEVVAKGGRGSGKSSYLSIELVWQLLRRPDCHAVVLRKVGGTLRNSVYNQIVWAIGELGCAGYFRCTVSPMECTYLPTGQKILFFGLDDPGKLKSLKLPFGSVGICWFEELDQFDGPEEVRNVEQTVLRGGSWALTLKSFNPPVEAVRIRKSVGCEHTLEKDISKRSSVIIELYHAAVELVGRLEHTNFRGNTLTLKIKFHDFSQITRSMTQTKELVALDVILPLAKQLLQEVDYEHHPIRLIGLSVSNPREEGEEKGVWEQLSFEFSDWETEHSNK